MEHTYTSVGVSGDGQGWWCIHERRSEVSTRMCTVTGVWGFGRVLVVVTGYGGGWDWEDVYER